MKSIIILISILFLSLTSCNTRESHIKQAVRTQIEEFPATNLLDIYKSFFQDKFGPGHIVADTAAARRYIVSELESAKTYNSHYFEPTGLGENFYRVSLAAVADSIVPLDIYCDAFYRSVRDIDPVEIEQWKEEWGRTLRVVEKMNLDLPDFEENAAAIDSMLNKGKYVSHHSERYNQYHTPHYRLFKKDIFINEIQPLIDATRIPGTSHKK